MDPTTLVSVEEYLHTDYSPDCEFVDGVLEGRNVGLRTHGLTQSRILVFLMQFEQQFDLLVLLSLHVRTGPTRFRVPDVSVLRRSDPDEEIVTTPPFLCVEVLSPDDRMIAMERKIGDYLKMGVPYVWLVDPYARVAWTYAAEARTDGVLRTKDPDIEMPLSDVLP